MNPQRKKMSQCATALLSLAVLASGCAPAGPAPKGTQSPTLAATDPSLDWTLSPTIPTDGPGDWSFPESSQGDFDSVTQVRLSQKPSGWWSGYQNGDSYYFTADSPEALKDGLHQRGGMDLSLEKFDEAFFLENRLVVIPRTANSGSVSYFCTFSPKDGGVELTIGAQSPEYGTTDMADFLLFVAVPLADYPADAPITVNPQGNPVGGGSGLVTK